MSGLDSIPIEVAGEPVEVDAARALLLEIDRMLGRLAAGGEGEVIDLLGLPLSPDDRDYLAEVLGEGEVRAEVQTLGLSLLQETAVPGVWWVTHYGEEDRVMAEVIEVTRVPKILQTQEGDLLEARELLAERMEEFDTFADEEE